MYFQLFKLENSIQKRSYKVISCLKISNSYCRKHRKYFSREMVWKFAQDRFWNVIIGRSFQNYPKKISHYTPLRKRRIPVSNHTRPLIRPFVWSWRHHKNYRSKIQTPFKKKTFAEYRHGEYGASSRTVVGATSGR